MTFLGQVESTTNNHLGVKSGSSSVHSRRSSVHEQYEQVATRIVTEENIAKQIMPIYRDLPDYQLISKLGE
jgi:hypothetical protein